MMCMILKKFREVATDFRASNGESGSRGIVTGINQLVVLGDYGMIRKCYRGTSKVAYNCILLWSSCKDRVKRRC